MGDIIIKPRTLKSGKVVYEYAFEIASIDGKCLYLRCSPDAITRLF